METVRNLIFLGSRITADGDCSHEIKTLGPWKKSYDQPRLRSRDITLPTNVYLVKAMVFPVVMYGCESWTTKSAECQTVVLEKTLESPLDNKEIQPVNSKCNQS